METMIQRANRIKTEYGIKEFEFKNSFFSQAKIESSDEKDHTVLKYITKPTLDRSKEVVISQGVDLGEFLKSPQILYAHNYGNSWFDGGNPVLPIGMDQWVKYDGKGLLAKQQYNMVTQLSKDIFNMHNTGFPLASSIGFIPMKTIYKSSFDDKEWENEKQRLSSDYGIDIANFKFAKVIYEKSLLLEHSDVPVPANPDALALALKSGQISFKSEELSKIFENVFLNNKIEELQDMVKQLQNDHIILQATITRFTKDMTIAPARPKSITQEYINTRLGLVIENVMNKHLGKM